MTMFENIKADLNRYFIPFEESQKKGLSFFSKILMILLIPGIQATIVYRFRRWGKNNVPIPVFKKIFAIFGVIMNQLMIILYGIQINPNFDIGPGLYIGHFGNILLGAVKMGKNCNVSQGVTIGSGGRGENWGRPEIGDNVYIAAGSKIFGKITIGNNVAIGANAVVTKSLPDNAVAAGVPARIISYKGSEDFIKVRLY